MISQDSTEIVTEREKQKPRFYPEKVEGFDGQKFLQEHYLEMNYDFDEINGRPVLIVTKKD